jgi:hypothetical protein
MYGSYDDMQDWKYREENPGYEREIGLTAGDLDDCDPDLAREVAEIYARDNGKRREQNHRTEVAGLRALLKENGIEIPDHL